MLARGTLNLSPFIALAIILNRNELLWSRKDFQRRTSEQTEWPSRRRQRKETEKTKKEGEKKEKEKKKKRELADGGDGGGNGGGKSNLKEDRGSKVKQKEGVGREKREKSS